MTTPRSSHRRTTRTAPGATAIWPRRAHPKRLTLQPLPLHQSWAGRQPQPGLLEWRRWSGCQLQPERLRCQLSGGGKHYHIPAVPGRLPPWPDGEYSDYRFTAPGAGTYALSSIFTGIDRHGSAAKDIHVLYNGTELYDDLLPGGYGSTKTYHATLTLAKGDHVDFVLGYGLGPWYYDSTALRARLTVVAAPATHFAVAGPSSSQAGKFFSVTA